MTVRKTQESTEISIMEISRGQIHFKLLGITPMICHAMSAKVMQELLLPAAKKNAAEKASNAKHHVMTEFRDSMYKAREADAPTRIVMPAVNFKQALCCAAIDIPGAARTQMSRLTFVENDYIPIYGIPQLLMSVVRNSDIKRTPDVRTRAILPRWAWLKWSRGNGQLGYGMQRSVLAEVDWSGSERTNKDWLKWTGSEGLGEA